MDQSAVAMMGHFMHAASATGPESLLSIAASALLFLGIFLLASGRFWRISPDTLARRLTRTTPAVIIGFLFLSIAAPVFMHIYYLESINSGSAYSSSFVSQTAVEDAVRTELIAQMRPEPEWRSRVTCLDLAASHLSADKWNQTYIDVMKKDLAEHGQNSPLYPLTLQDLTTPEHGVDILLSRATDAQSALKQMGITLDYTWATASLVQTYLREQYPVTLRGYEEGTAHKDVVDYMARCPSAGAAPALGPTPAVFQLDGLRGVKKIDLTIVARQLGENMLKHWQILALTLALTGLVLLLLRWGLLRRAAHKHPAAAYLLAIVLTMGTLSTANFGFLFLTLDKSGAASGEPYPNLISQSIMIAMNSLLILGQATVEDPAHGANYNCMFGVAEVLVKRDLPPLPEKTEASIFHLNQGVAKLQAYLPQLQTALAAYHPTLADVKVLVSQNEALKKSCAGATWPQ